MSVDTAAAGKMRFIYGQLFQGSDPFSEVFTEKLPHRLMLCPTEGYFLTEEQYTALVKTMKALGEPVLFVSEVEGGPDFANCAGHWRVGVETPYEEYCKLPVYLENAIYSESGLWGLIISHEEHALFGGNGNSARWFKEALPGWQLGVAQFLQKWEYNQRVYGSKVDWIPKLLAHIQQDPAD